MTDEEFTTTPEYNQVCVDFGLTPGPDAAADLPFAKLNEFFDACDAAKARLEAA